MKYYHFLALALSSSLFSVCSMPRTIWSSGKSAPIHYNKIMVAVIPDVKNDSIRAVFEQEVVDRLQEMGYLAVASSKEFVPGKLSRLNEEATYLTLCDEGIDAILTFAEVDNSVKHTLRKGVSEKYSHPFYFGRIWDYRNIRRNVAGNVTNRTLEWECILFDLPTLETQAALRYGHMDITEGNGAVVLADKFIQKMVREKVLKNRDNTPNHRKPF